MKPDWKNAPRWANYVAMDADGKWYWYENEPAYSPDHMIWTTSAGGIKEASDPVSAYSTLERRL